MKQFLIYTMLILSILGCRKTKLKHEKDVLIGKWQWTESTQKTLCDKYSWQTIYDTITPVFVGGNKYELEFLKTGKLFFYRNEKIVKKRRLVIKEWNVCNHGNCEYYFTAKLDNRKNQIMSFQLNQNLLTTYSFPFSPEDDCQSVKNVFEKK